MEFFSLCDGIVIHIADSARSNLEYERTVILLHGYLETLYIWDDFVPLIDDNTRVVRIDLPGHGMSGSYEINTMAFCARSVVAVMDKLGIEKAWIAGHSMGGYVLAEAVKLYESRFYGAIMLNSTTYADSSDKKEHREREISLIDHNKLQSVVRVSVPKMFALENRPAMEEKILEITEISEVHDPTGIKASLRGIMEREDNTEAMAASKLPKLFLFGNQDHFISVEVAENLLKKISGCEAHFFEGCGHNSFLEKPHESAAIINEFINKNSQQ